MNESIKFAKDDPKGRYAKDDTGVMVAVMYTPFYGETAVVRDTNDKYVTAPLAHIEHVTEGD